MSMFDEIKEKLKEIREQPIMMYPTMVTIKLDLALEMAQMADKYIQIREISKDLTVETPKEITQEQYDKEVEYVKQLMYNQLLCRGPEYASVAQAEAQRYLAMMKLRIVKPGNKKNYQIDLTGCDDTTTIFLELDDAEFELIRIVAAKCTAKSRYSCMPTMSIYLSSRDPSEDDDEDEPDKPGDIRIPGQVVATALHSAIDEIFENAVKNTKKDWEYKKIVEGKWGKEDD